MLTKRETARLIAEGGINQKRIIYDRKIVNQILGYEQFRLSSVQVNLG
jgi:hypothetical protein